MVAEIPKTLHAVDDTQPQPDHNNIEMKGEKSYHDDVHSKDVVPCSYESPGLVTSGYCAPLGISRAKLAPKRSSIQRQILVPETNFTCYLDADVIPGKLEKRVYNHPYDTAKSLKQAMYCLQARASIIIVTQ